MKNLFICLCLLFLIGSLGCEKDPKINPIPPVKPLDTIPKPLDTVQVNSVIGDLGGKHFKFANNYSSLKFAKSDYNQLLDGPVSLEENIIEPKNEQLTILIGRSSVATSSLPNQENLVYNASSYGIGLAITLPKANKNETVEQLLDTYLKKGTYEIEGKNTTTNGFDIGLYYFASSGSLKIPDQFYKYANASLGEQPTKSTLTFTEVTYIDKNGKRYYSLKGTAAGQLYAAASATKSSIGRLENVNFSAKIEIPIKGVNYFKPLPITTVIGKCDSIGPSYFSATLANGLTTCYTANTADWHFVGQRPYAPKTNDIIGSYLSIYCNPHWVGQYFYVLTRYTENSGFGFVLPLGTSSNVSFKTRFDKLIKDNAVFKVIGKNDDPSSGIEFRISSKLSVSYQFQSSEPDFDHPYASTAFGSQDNAKIQFTKVEMIPNGTNGTIYMIRGVVSCKLYNSSRLQEAGTLFADLKDVPFSYKLILKD